MKFHEISSQSSTGLLKFRISYISEKIGISNIGNEKRKFLYPEFAALCMLRLTRKEGALFRPPFLPVVFFFCAPSFFLVLRAFFFSPLSALLFFLFATFQLQKPKLWLKKHVFQEIFPFFARALFMPSFFFLLKAPSFFFFGFEGYFFRPLFALPFFSRPPFQLTYICYIV